jgi:hypothetical protein
MTLDASGNLGIGSTSIAAVGAYRVVEINGTSGGYLALEQSGTKYGAIGASSGSLFLEAFGASTPLIFYTNGAERMTIDTSGNLLVGETSGYLSSRVLVKTTTTDSSTNALTLRNSASTELFRVRSDGYTYAGFYPQTTGSAANVFIGSGGDLLRSTSSLKYKQDVQNTVHGLAEVMQLRSVTYKGKSEADGDKVFGGLIAEEVHEAGLTEFVQYAEDGSPDALAYGNMVSLAFKAIQEQQVIINDLKARIETLESK